MNIVQIRNMLYHAAHYLRVANNEGIIPPEVVGRAEAIQTLSSLHNEFDKQTSRQHTRCKRCKEIADVAVN